jgi:diguanylate cyclase (GGDEF)-like protein
MVYPASQWDGGQLQSSADGGWNERQQMIKKGFKTIKDRITDINKDFMVEGELKSRLDLLLKEVKKISENENVLSNLVNIDGLTGLYNHKYFHQCLVRELSQAARFKYELALVMFDLDHFKKLNDTYGHPLGDIVLKKIADVMKRNIRSYDTICRYGGEEFTLILPHTGRRGARVIAEKLRKAMANISFYGVKSGKKEKFTVTISAGVAAFPDNARTKSVLIKRADKALYLAKEEGRNNVCSSLVTGKDYISFAFCPPTLSPFYASVLRGIREVAEEIGNVELDVMAGSTEQSYKEQITLMNKALVNGVDAIGICSKIDIGSIVSKANKMGIKVFIFNFRHVKMTPPGKILSYICYDQVQAGKKIANFIIRLLRGSGNVAVLEGIPDEIDSIERKKGFMQTISKYPKMKIMASEPAYWDREKAREKTLRILKKHPEVDAIFGLSDEMALGALDAVRKARKTGKIFTVGLDGNQNALKSVKEGELTGTLNTNPIDMGRIMIRAVLKSMFKQDRVPGRIESPTTVVDLENVEKYL